LCGCADFGAPVGGNAPLSAEESRFQAVEGRLADLTRKLDNLNLASQSRDLPRLESEMRALRGEVERLRYDVDSNEKRARELYQDLDRRIQKLEAESRPARLTMEPKISNAPLAPASQEEEATYLRNFDLLKSARYDEAIAGFRDMQVRWPQGRYADNALYWLGESHYVKREYDKALESFRSLMERFPASPKVPDALLKVGLAQLELKQPEDAKGTLQKLIADYPNTNAARLARQRLEQPPQQ
jgi:tol-pal system protein YbgF